MNRGRKGEDRVHEYPCQICNGYHVGHRATRAERHRIEIADEDVPF